MAKGRIRKCIAIVAALAGASMSTAAMADEWYNYNDGNGTCGYVVCGAHGCALIMTFPCPREVSED